MINLLPPEHKEALRYARLNVVLIKYVLIVLIVGGTLNALLFFGGTYINSTKNEVEANLEADKATIAELESINEEAKSLSTSITTISTLLDQEVKFSKLLREIGSVLPDGIVLRDLQLSDDRSAPLRLEVNAVSPEAVGTFQVNLTESSLFRGADISIVEKTGSDGEYPYNASLSAFFATSSVEAQNE